jgi:hypothetical protein
MRLAKPVGEKLEVGLTKRAKRDFGVDDGHLKVVSAGMHLAKPALKYGRSVMGWTHILP